MNQGRESMFYNAQRAAETNLQNEGPTPPQKNNNNEKEGENDDLLMMTEKQQQKQEELQQEYLKWHKEVLQKRKFIKYTTKKSLTTFQKIIYDQLIDSS